MEKSSNSSAGMPGRGYLVVSVRTGSGAIPLPGALVTLRGEDSAEGDAIASFISDQSGNTPRITLPAPPRAASESPGNGKPYASYSADISLEGYHTNLYTNIPIFDGITSVQTAYLVPLPENGSGNAREIFTFDARTGEQLTGDDNE